jgi:DNA recombination protein RmuC
MNRELSIILAVIVSGFVVLYFLIKNALGQQSQDKHVEDTVNKVFGLTSQHIAEQSRQILQSEKESIRVDLANKQQTIEKLVQTLQSEMKVRQEEMHALEKDRTQKFGEMTTALEQHRKLADELRVSTQQLASVLSNNQARGEWGERILEDLLQSNGLVEGVHYAKQAKLVSTSLRPDITLILPNNRNVPVDVKFPYAEIQKMADSDTKQEKEAHLKQFASDLRIKITKVAGYINPEFQTLDYAILFVPNEMIFSFINQKFPDIVDEAIAQKVMIVSPFTFLIVARTVIESYRNFMMEDKLRDIIQYVSEFVMEWGKFHDEFAKFGRSIESLKTGYDALTTTRTMQMNKKIKKIEQYQNGVLLKEGARRQFEIAQGNSRTKNAKSL